MYETFELTKRNIKVYLRDKAAVFFSFLSVIILLGLYILFLGNNFKPNQLVGILTDQELNFLVYSQLLPGIMIINAVSIPLGNLGNIINDFEYRKLDGFLVAPVKRGKVILSYYLSSFLITVVISIFMIIVAYVAIGLYTGIFFDIDVILLSILYVTLFAFVSTAIMIFVTSFIKSVNAFGAFSGVFGTVVGFISGIYMPLFILPSFIKGVASLVPFTHMTIMLKQVMMKQAFLMLDVKLQPLMTEAEYQSFLTNYQEAVGYSSLDIFGLDVPFWLIAIGMGIISVVCLVLSTYRLSKRIAKK